MVSRICEYSEHNYGEINGKKEILNSKSLTSLEESDFHNSGLISSLLF